MRKGDEQFFKHPLVQTMFKNNQPFYEQVKNENNPIERLVGRPNRTSPDVIKVLAFGILGNQREFVRLLNKYHFIWRRSL